MADITIITAIAIMVAIFMVYVATIPLAHGNH
jgi:hypothetical protein